MVLACPVYSILFTKHPNTNYIKLLIFHTMAHYEFSRSLLNGFQSDSQIQTPQPNLPEAIDDPFKDPSIMSRTTATGFTDNNHLKEEFERLKLDALDQIHELTDVLNDARKDPAKIQQLKNAQTEVEKLNARIMRLQERILPTIIAQNQQNENQQIENDIMSQLSKSTIRPNESASVMKPRMQGTELTMYSGIRSSVVRGSDHDNVVGGYELTAEDHLEEVDAINNIQRVYGLPKIFIDDRLNFLVHLHKPLQTMLTKKSQDKVSYPDPNSLEKLTHFIDRSKGRHREPHHELLYQVLKATIDVRRKRIRANPFNLPIIEVGMNLDDQIVFMCISELYSEFRTTWFHSMKNVEPPHFATDYVGVCQPTSYKRAVKPVTDNRRKRRGSSSILGSILSA